MKTTDHRRHRATATLACSLAVLAMAATACSSAGGNSAPPTSSQPAAPAASQAAGSGATQNGSSAPHDLLPASIKKAGVIRVASSIGFAPYEFYAADGKTFEGLDIDILNALGPALGVKMKITDTRYPDIPSALKAGRADIAMSAFEEEPSEYATVSFVSYIQGNSSVIVSKDQTKVQPNDPASMCGVSLGIVSGEVGDLPYVKSTDAQCKKLGKPNIQIKTFQRTADALLAVKSGQLDARVSGDLSAIYIANNSGGTLKVVENPLQEKPTISGIGVPKGDDQMLRALQAGMQKLAADGTYQKILQKWHVPSGDALSSFPIVPPLSAS